MTFNDRTALVTGAGRGIGRSIALRLATLGVRVLCVSKSETCRQVADEIQAAGGRAEAHIVDVADGAAVAAAGSAILAAHQRVDILVNNAGITRDNLLLRMKDDEWHAVLRTNLDSCFYWTRGLIHPMARNRWGRVISISSVIGLHGNSGQCNYAAAKAGQIGFTKAVAKEFASRSITANAIAPGFIETDMTSSLGADVTAKVTERIGLRRLGSTADIASLAAFLASEEAGYVTGQVFAVDGGLAL